MMHWSESKAKDVIDKFPEVEEYTVSSGISPSGVVHVGNLRDVITADFVYKSLKGLGNDARFVMFWDDYDRFRKVPDNVPEEFQKYIGKPLSEIPDPHNEFESYAKRNEIQFENELKKIGITPDFKYQSEQYKKGSYNEEILKVLQNRKKIAHILSRHMSSEMTDEEINNYYPVKVYSQFTGKDNTEVVDFNPENGSIKYECKDSGKTGVRRIEDGGGLKLSWKVDWPMRWYKEKVNFEPFGKDHATAGGSYDIGSEIIRKIFDREPPVGQPYEFIGIRGGSGKISGSSGESVTVLDLLEVYEPELIRWIYASTQPKSTFSFAFDEDVIRQYSEFDKDVAAKKQQDSINEVALSKVGNGFYDNPIPFRTSKGYGQTTQFEPEKIKLLLEEKGESYDEESLESRLDKAEKWIEKHNPEEKIELLKNPNTSYLDNMSVEEKRQIKELVRVLDEYEDLGELENAIYKIPKSKEKSNSENKKSMKNFFQNSYNLLFGKNRGPRLSTFLWLSEKNEVKSLLQDFD